MALTKRDLEQIGELLEQQSNDFGGLIRGTVIPPIEELQKSTRQLQKSTKELQKSVDSIERELAKKDDRLDDHGRRIERLEGNTTVLKSS